MIEIPVTLYSADIFTVINSDVDWSLMRYKYMRVIEIKLKYWQIAIEVTKQLYSKVQHKHIIFWLHRIWQSNGFLYMQI